MQVESELPQVLREIRKHGALKLAVVGKQFPALRGEGNIGPVTVWRWIMRGARTPNGSLVKLEAVKVGPAWMTSQAAVDRFIMALTAASTPATVALTPTVPNADDTAKRSSNAADRLRDMGA